MSNNKGLKVYIAAPFFTSEQLDVVKKIELILEHHGIEYFSPRSEGTLKDMTDEERRAKMGEVFRSNVDHMDWCTHAIAVIDNYDTGTVWEMGYLYATHKKIVSFSNNYYGINVMLNEAIVSHCTEFGTLFQALKYQYEGHKTEKVT